MKQKELRLALVCYGGISLAVYMYGVSREIQKLVRASKTYFTPEDPNERASLSYDQLNEDIDRETDTERGYFEMLQEIGKSLHLKVFVDIVSGASAGGINGIYLARAIAHDLPLDPLRRLWLDQADVESLIDPANKPGKVARVIKRPALWLMRRRNFADISAMTQRMADPEIEDKLAFFITSRWFRPPFSGSWLSNMLVEGALAMGQSESAFESCLPGNRTLDLFVTVTDFNGYRVELDLHDPSSVEEVEHRQILSFQHKISPINSRLDFADENIPGIMFAARATSSFPGAFPPAQLQEMDAVLAARGMDWPVRGEFIQRSFGPHMRCGLAPEEITLIDGSVLNNKPFGPAIEALRQRVAHRQVDRRIVYIDPNPPAPRDIKIQGLPGFFRTLSGAISEIPRNQPIRDDLEALTDLSQETARLRQVISSARPRVTQTIEKLLGPALRKGSLTPKALADWRARAEALAEREAGFAFDGYLSLRLLLLLEELSRAVARFSRQDVEEVFDEVRAWAAGQNIFPFDSNDKTKPWRRILLDFDLDFRVRRMRFVIRRINDLYTEIGAPSEALDSLKGLLYAEHGALRGMMSGPLLFFLRRETPVADRLDELSKTFLLRQVDAETDAAIASHLDWLDEKAMGREILVAYLGFDFFDTLIYPITRRHDVDELDEVCVDRISPEDAISLSQEGKQALRGIDFGRFGAFFSYGFRENDYLWGRLHGAERLVDIVASSAAASGCHIDRLAFKKRLFQLILAREAPRLTRVNPLIDDLRARTAQLGQDPALTADAGPAVAEQPAPGTPPAPRPATPAAPADAAQDPELEPDAQPADRRPEVADTNAL